jgi:dolichyl-phosphate-mannose-protein mannosyltransferase
MHMKLIYRYPELLILTILALMTRLWSIFTPAAVVFDEVYFKVYAGDYLTGSYYFDPHPPLGKLLLGGWAWLTRLDPSTLIGSQPAVSLRILPALAGALIIPVFFILLRQLGASRRMATLGAALLLLDNAILVESRFILVDSMLILFGISAVTCYLAARRRSGKLKITLALASAVLAGLSVSTKWTGLTAIALIVFIWLYDQFSRPQQRSLPIRLALASGYVIIPLLVYMSVFWVHFALLSKTGQGDAFMPLRFQSTLVGNANYNPSVHLSFLEKFIDLNVEMNQSEASLVKATHPYGSKWYTWPIMERPIYYWEGDVQPDNSQGNIYLLGNPVVWWGILMVLVAGAAASGKAIRRLHKFRMPLIVLAVAYIINFLPFSTIVRVMFLYHYFFAFIFSLAFAVILLGALGNWTEDSPHPWRFSSNASRNLYFGILGAAVLGFIYFAPLSYGIPLSPTALAQHMWLSSWR